MSANLELLIREWRDWASKAPQSEDGWQSAFPEWNDLMQAAMQMMTKQPLSARDIKDLEFCWDISEETEDLADFAKHHEVSGDTLTQLASSADPRVRWQIYSVLGFRGAGGEALLRNALEDPDPYCRRRAILSLARLKPKDAKHLAERFNQDEDPYVRKAALELAGTVGNHSV